MVQWRSGIIFIFEADNRNIFHRLEIYWQSMFYDNIGFAPDFM